MVVVDVVVVVLVVVVVVVVVVVLVVVVVVVVVDVVVFVVLVVVVVEDVVVVVVVVTALVVPVATRLITTAGIVPAATTPANIHSDKRSLGTKPLDLQINHANTLYMIAYWYTMIHTVCLPLPANYRLGHRFLAHRVMSELVHSTPEVFWTMDC